MSFLSLSSAQRSAARSAVDYRFTIFLSAIPFHAINSNTSKCWTTAEVQTSHRNGSQLLRFAILIALVPHRRSPRRAAKLYSVQQLTEREKKTPLPLAKQLTDRSIPPSVPTTRTATNEDILVVLFSLFAHHRFMLTGVRCAVSSY